MYQKQKINKYNTADNVYSVYLKGHFMVIGENTEEFYKIIQDLRGPDGCPWDKKQTLSSLRQYLIEESFEVISAINEENDDGINEELGDVLLVVFMMSIIGSEKGKFTLEEILKTVIKKIIRRHPHVFSSATADSPEEVKELWDTIKTEEKENKQKTVKENDFAVTNSLPEIERSYKIQKEMGKIGFDWDNVEPVIGKLKEEINEFEEERKKPNNEIRVEEELGDMLFTVINISRKMKIHPSVALHRANEKIIKRFAYVKNNTDKNVVDHDQKLKLMERLWNSTKPIS